MSEVFIVAGSRTAIGSFQGQFAKTSAVDLGATVIAETLKRASLTPDDVDEVIMGQILTAGQGQNPARQAAVKAQVPYSTPAFTINMLCGSGLKAVTLAYQAIKNEDCEIVIAGGQENMTRAQHTADVRGTKMGTVQMADSLLKDGLMDAFFDVHMGQTAEHLAKDTNTSREAQDQFALRSQQKAQAAIESGYFAKEIVPITDDRTGKAIDKDEFPRANSTIEGLAKLRPAFSSNGTVTAGNASGINDGAACVVLCNERQLKLKNLKPMAKIIAFAQVGVNPMEMGLGPVGAVKKVLEKAGWNKDQVDLYELNEAFAVQSILVAKELAVDEAKLNVSGGAIALGHPVGASGARVLVTLLYNLERLNKKKGIASLCIGGGMGIAIAVERC